VVGFDAPDFIKRMSLRSSLASRHPPRVDEDEAIATAKRRLARVTSRLLFRISSSQADAASVLGTSQPIVSALKRGKIDGMTFDRLLRFANRMGLDAEIRVRPSQASFPRGSVTVRIEMACFKIPHQQLLRSRPGPPRQRRWRRKE
jgi:predicted XRE-type DNA-binding protein